MSCASDSTTTALCVCKRAHHNHLPAAWRWGFRFWKCDCICIAALLPIAAAPCPTWRAEREVGWTWPSLLAHSLCQLLQAGRQIRKDPGHAQPRAQYPWLFILLLLLHLKYLYPKVSGTAVGITSVTVSLLNASSWILSPGGVRAPAQGCKAFRACLSLFFLPHILA